MDEKNKLSAEEMKNVSGGYILDRGPREYNDSNRYVAIDDETGQILCFANTLEGITNTRAIKRNSSDIITEDDYERIFGRRPFKS